MTNKLKMVSGIQPTNNITIGNFLGAIRNFIKYQDNYEMYVFIADLHAITTSQDINLKTNKLNIAKLYLACGLDPQRVVIFNQSEVIEHTLLGHIMLCHTTIGELSRMTQFKDKSQKSKLANGTEFIPTGLLTYPALMAADILLYDADVVMVGMDQKQHLELTKNLAERFNNKYKSDIFKIPNFYTETTSAKIMDLLTPTRKMSKSSDNPKGTIFLSDSPEIAHKKIMAALTDNLNTVKYDAEKQPGVTNLINIYAALTDKTIKVIEDEFNGVKNYGEFKKTVADEVVKFLKNIQNKISLIKDSDVERALQIGRSKAQAYAHNKMEIVLKQIGMK